MWCHFIALSQAGLGYDVYLQTCHRQFRADLRWSCEEVDRDKIIKEVCALNLFLSLFSLEAWGYSPFFSSQTFNQSLRWWHLAYYLFCCESTLVVS